MKNKLYIISVDALESQDIEILKTLPNFSYIMENGAVVTGVREVYPTLTNVNHVSIITGATPAVHGVFHNQHPYAPNADSNWNVIGFNWMWESSNIRCETLIDAAKKAGLKTCCCTWPSMGGTGGNVAEWNVAEIWPHLFPSVRESYAASCTPNAMERYYDKYVAPFDFSKSFDVDPLNVEIVCDMIENLNPDLLLHHIITLDAVRHKNGNNSEKVRLALARADGFIGKIIEASKRAGTFEETNFAIVGDHGQICVKEQFNINVELNKRGILGQKDGLITDYTAYSFSCGFSGLIIMKDGATEEDKNRVYRALVDIANEYPDKIERIFTQEEAAEEGLAGPFAFVVETVEGVSLGNALSGETVISVNSPDYHYYKSNHGYHPSKGPKTLFIACGPNIRQGARVNGVSIMQECPTFAEILGVTVKEAKLPPIDILK